MNTKNYDSKDEVLHFQNVEMLTVLVDKKDNYAIIAVLMYDAKWRVVILELLIGHSYYVHLIIHILLVFPHSISFADVVVYIIHF
jgi:hypothetical protein